MRIVGGEWRGLRLSALKSGDTKAHLRPTTDRNRETIFNILLGGRFGDPIDAADVLDLFAGTGALGLEALSRGAKRATFVDSGHVAQKLLRENIRKTGSMDRCRVIARDTMRIPKAEAPSSLIFLDPPYGKSLGPKAIGSALDAGGIADGALIVAEDQEPLPAVAGMDQLETRKIGSAHITFLRASAPTLRH